MPNPDGLQTQVFDVLITSCARAFARACTVTGDGVLANQLKRDADEDAADESA